MGTRLDSGWKGGIGTSSRQLPLAQGGYAIGALVQSNFGGLLHVLGVPVGNASRRRDTEEPQADASPGTQASAPASGGSIMIVLATDAPLSDRNLARLARRGLAGLARTGADLSNGSGDYAVAFSTAESSAGARRSAVASSPISPNCPTT